MKVVEMTSETRRVPYSITDRTQEHVTGRNEKASQKELIGAIIGFIARNGSELLRGIDEKRLDYEGIVGIYCRGDGGQGIYGSLCNSRVHVLFHSSGGYGYGNAVSSTSNIRIDAEGVKGD